MEAMNGFRAFLLTVLLATSIGCGSSEDVDPALNSDESPSELAIAVLSGAINGSISGGTLALAPAREKTLFARALDFFWPIRLAYAAVTCPTATVPISSCSAAGNVMTLTYSGCSFGDPDFSWNGRAVLTSSAAVSCGTFPSQSPGATLTRTFGSASVGVTTTRTWGLKSHFTTVDTDGSGYSIAAGGGTTITFGAGGTHSLNVNGVHLTATRTGTSKNGEPRQRLVWDTTVHTGSPLTVYESLTDKVIDGTITVQNNLTRTTASTTLTNVRYALSSGCCHPQSGSVTTTFAGSTRTQTLSFGAVCGSAGIVDSETGTIPSFKLVHCY
jgi:hypothetical protein